MVRQRFQKALKAAFDRIVGLTALITFLPLMALIAAAIRLTMGAPVLFRQQRPGLHEQLFVLYKFRTMTESRDADGGLRTDAERLTWVGRFLRASSLDELPQLWNVVRGDLSLVGPRPLLVQYLGRYSPEQRRRHEVRPGITGWAQINGRNSISWKEKFALDVWYVDNWSFRLDMQILLLTIVRVLRREGTSHEGHVSMPEFTGDED